MASPVSRSSQGPLEPLIASNAPQGPFVPSNSSVGRKSDGPLSSTPPPSNRSAPSNHVNAASLSPCREESTPVSASSLFGSHRTPQPTRERSVESEDAHDTSNESFSFTGPNSSGNHSWNTSLTSLSHSISGSRKVSAVAVPPNSVVNSPERHTMPQETIRRCRTSSAAFHLSELQNASPIKAIGNNLDRTKLSPIVANRIVSQNGDPSLGGSYAEEYPARPKKLNPPLLPSLSVLI